MIATTETRLLGDPVVLLLRRLLLDANSLRGKRQALDELEAVRHTALSYEAYLLYTATVSQVFDDLCALAESYGLQSHEIRPEEDR